MLNNYDAVGIANVMGIGFFRSIAARVIGSPTPAPGASRDIFGRRNHISGDVTVMLIVEVKDDNTLQMFDGMKKNIEVFGKLHHDQLSKPSAAFIENAVEYGLPRRVLRHVVERVALGDKSKATLLEQGLVPKTTLENRKTQLSPQQSERTERLARLFVHATRALGTEAEAGEFMTAPHPQLDQRSPAEAARTDLGARRTEQILNALEYGLAI